MLSNSGFITKVEVNCKCIKFKHGNTQRNISKTKFLFVKVYDYDWGLRDDFIGQATVNLKNMLNNNSMDVLLTLHDTGNINSRKTTTSTTPRI